MNLNFDRIHIFGDSLSDTDNVLNFTLSEFPVAPYERGRFSNGNVWVDYFADELNLDVDPFSNPFNFLANNDGINYAIGGATSGNDNVGVVPLGLEQQIDAFETSMMFQSAEETVEDDLFFLWVGANDYFSFIEDDPTTPDVVETNFPQNSRETIDAVIDVVDINIRGAVQDIIDAGGQDIVIFNLPDLSDALLADNLTRQDSRKLRQLTNRHNRRLDRLVDNIERTNPDVNLIEIDVNELADEISDNPSEFGLTNVTDNFSGIDILEELNQPPASGNPNEYFYWDSVHPSTTVHDSVADLVMDELSNEGLIA